MRRLELAIVAGFLIMFVAGLAAGLTFSRYHPVAAATTPASDPPAKPDDHFHTLGRELNLTPEQKQKMEAVWKVAFARSEKSHKAIADEDKAREAAIRKLMTPEMLEDYDRIQREHETKVGELRGAIGQDMRQTNEKIRALLTPDQLKKFDQMAREHHRHGPPPKGGPPGPGPSFGPHHFHPRRGPDTSTTRPSLPTTAPAE